MNRSNPTTGAALILVLAVTTTAGASRAAPPTSSSPTSSSPSASSPSVSAQAAELKKQGDLAMNSLRYADALDAYARAFELSGDPALLYNKGRALEALARYPEALVEFERFAAEAPLALRAKVPKLAELIADIRGRVATLVVECEVAGATILVRGQTVGTCPASQPFKVVAGRARVQVVADGYESFDVEQLLAGGQSTRIVAQLTPRVVYGALRIDTNVTGAVVLLDGKTFGTAPVEASVTGGTHQVEVRRTGWEPRSMTVVVAPGEHKSIHLQLSPEKVALTSRWWFWTGVGVVVVTGVAVTAALLTERPADRGSLGPGQVTAPLLRF